MEKVGQKSMDKGCNMGSRCENLKIKDIKITLYGGNSKMKEREGEKR